MRGEEDVRLSYESDHCHTEELWVGQIQYIQDQSEDVHHKKSAEEWFNELIVRSPGKPYTKYEVPGIISCQIAPEETLTMADLHGEVIVKVLVENG